MIAIGTPFEQNKLFCKQKKMKAIKRINISYLLRKKTLNIIQIKYKF